MNYDELVERLRDLSKHGKKCEGCPWGDEYPECAGCFTKTSKQAADAIVSLQKQLESEGDI